MGAYFRRGFDWAIPLLMSVLAVISAATIYTITYVSVGPSLAQSQIIYLSIGLILFLLMSRLDYRNVRDWTYVIFGISLIACIPLLPYWSQKIPFVICEFSSCRWIDLAFFRFQSSEVVKLTVVLFLGRIASDYYGSLRWQHGVGLLLVLGLATFFVSEQPDLGSAIIIFICGVTVLLMAGLSRWFWIVCIIFGLAVTPVVWQNLKPYQKRRIEIFLNPSRDPAKTGYNVRQAEIAVGSGGLLGQGFGQGSQSQLNFLPVAHTDFIFAGYAEATGLVGSLALLLIYFVLLARILVVTLGSKDLFGKMVGVGITAQLTSQVIINVGMNIGLMPVTGVPLALVSFGGTSVFMTCIALGIVESIAMSRPTARLN